MSEHFQYIIHKKNESTAGVPAEADEYFAALNENDTISDLLALGEDLSIKADIVLSLWELNNKEDEKIENEFIFKMIDYINRFNYYKYKKGLSDYLHSQTFQLLLKLRNIANCELYISDHQEKIQGCASNIFNHFCDNDIASKGIWFEDLEAYLKDE